MICSVAYFISNWFINYFRVVGISVGGKIGNAIVGILGNPENLRKPLKNKFGINSRMKDLNPIQGFMNKKSKRPNIEMGSLAQNSYNLEDTDHINLGNIDPINSLIANKSRIDSKIRIPNNIEIGLLGQNTDNIKASYMISDKTNKNKRDKKFGSSILY